ncbi:hypothetical protein ACFL5O_09995 [Myxococcota bacterium]
MQPPTSPISVAIVHGEKDDVFPYEGGKPGDKELGLGAKEMAGHYLKAKKCTGDPKTDRDAKFTKDAYQCPDGSEVSLFSVPELGHSWPRKIGKTFIMRVMHQFFEQHKLRG